MPEQRGVPLGGALRVEYCGSMVETIDDLARGAIALPPDQRFTLAHRILASVEPEVELAIEGAWDAEIRDRIRRYDAGETVAIAAGEVFAEVENRLAR